MSCCHTSPVITFYPYLTGGLFISVITLALVTLSIKLFKLERPALKYQLMFLPLVAPLLAYLTYPPLIFRKYLILSSPYLIISKPISFAEDPLASTVALLLWVGIGGAILKGSLNLLAAWRLRKKYPSILPSDEPGLYKILNRLVKKTKLRRIDVLYLPKPIPSAFTFGFFKPTLAVSQGLLEKLTAKELEAVIAHEVAHLSRRDSLTIWLAGILRDIMFYNPLSYLVFSILNREKEKASDEWGITITKKPLAFAQSIFKMWKLLAKINPGSKPELATPYLIPKTSLLEERVVGALNSSGNAYPQKSRHLTWFVTVSIVLLWFLLINTGLLSPAKTGPYFHLNKPVTSGSKHISGQVYLHFSEDSQNRVSSVSMCTNSSCHNSSHAGM